DKVRKAIVAWYASTFSFGLICIDQFFFFFFLLTSIFTLIQLRLRENESYALDDKGSARIKDFLDRDEFAGWKDYCNYMAKSGVWGDHLTLIAASNVYD